MGNLICTFNNKSLETTPVQDTPLFDPETTPLVDIETITLVDTETTTLVDTETTQEDDTEPNCDTNFLFYDQMDDNNKKAVEIWTTQGVDKAIEHMFTHPETGDPINYSEMRSMYG